MKKIVKKGLGSSSRAQRGQECHINLKTTLADGTKVDDEHMEVFVLGDGDLTSVRCSIFFEHLLERIYLFLQVNSIISPIIAIIDDFLKMKPNFVLSDGSFHHKVVKNIL